jgi:hypothetical protein
VRSYAACNAVGKYFAERRDRHLPACPRIRGVVIRRIGIALLAVGTLGGVALLLVVGAGAAGKSSSASQTCATLHGRTWNNTKHGTTGNAWRIYAFGAVPCNIAVKTAMKFAGVAVRPSQLHANLARPKYELGASNGLVCYTEKTAVIAGHALYGDCTRTLPSGSPSYVRDDLIMWSFWDKPV